MPAGPAQAADAVIAAPAASENELAGPVLLQPPDALVPGPPAVTVPDPPRVTVPEPPRGVTAPGPPRGAQAPAGRQQKLAAETPGHPRAAPGQATPRTGPSGPPTSPGAPPVPAWLLTPSRKRGRVWSLIALAGIMLACAALAATAALLAMKGASVSGSADASVTGQLAQPPPGSAGGLPLRSSVLGNAATKRVITEFRKRFDAGLDLPATGETAGLYSEPGRVDPATNAPSWILYLGVNTPAQQQDPMASLTSLMAGLAGPAANDRPWRVAPGPAGGVARCVITVLGSTQVSACGWATPWTVGVLMSPTRDTNVTELAYLMSKMRPDLVQH